MFRVVGSVAFCCLAHVAAESSALFQTTIGADGGVHVENGLRNIWSSDSDRDQFATAVCNGDTMRIFLGNKTDDCGSLVSTVLDAVKASKDPTGYWLKNWIESTIESIEPMRAEDLPYSQVYRQCSAQCQGLGAVIVAYANARDLKMKMYPSRWYGKRIPPEIKREDQDRVFASQRRLRQSMCSAFAEATCKLDEMPSVCLQLREKAGIDDRELQYVSEGCAELNDLNRCSAVCPDAKDKILAARDKWREKAESGGKLTPDETSDLCHESAPALACNQQQECESSVDRFFPDVTRLQKMCEQTFG